MAENSENLVDLFDQLVRNSNVLSDGSEEEFLRFAVGAEQNRKRWENAEYECQRLNIELTKCSQEISSLESKLSHARNMLDAEISERKAMEAERNKFAHQLHVLRQILLEDRQLDEATIIKLKKSNLDDERELGDFFQPKGILKKSNVAEASVYDVDDFSFDDTRELCESFNTPNRSSSRGLRTPGNSAPSTPLEAAASPRRNRSGGSIKKRRKSVVFEQEDLENTDSAARRATKRRQDFSPVTERLQASSLHNFYQKPTLKKELCQVCGKRIKFGTVCVKCSNCRMTFHMECSDSSPKVCQRLERTPEVPKCPTGHDPSPLKKPYFASPMLH